MIIVVGIIVIALIVSMAVTSMKYSEGMLRKFIWTFNGITISVVAVALAILAYDSFSENSLGKQYGIAKGNAMYNLTYVDEIDEYYAVNSSGLFYSEDFFVVKEGVEASYLCKIFTPIKMYFPIEDQGIVYLDEAVFYDPYSYQVASNICKITPDYFWMALFVFIYDMMAFVPMNILVFIVVLIKISKKDKND